MRKLRRDSQGARANGRNEENLILLIMFPTSQDLGTGVSTDADDLVYSLWISDVSEEYSVEGEYK